MKLSRLGTLFSAKRFRQYADCFQNPLLAQWRLAFLRKNSFVLMGKNGQAVSLSREGGDHRFFDWLAEQQALSLQISADGELLVGRQGDFSLLLRPNSGDLAIFDEIWVRDTYGLAALPAKLESVVDLGGNVGLFSCRLLPRAERVITVEAATENVVQARKNVALCGGNPDHVLHRAMSGRSGEWVELFLDKDAPASHSLQAGWLSHLPNRSKTVERVETLSLEDLFAQYHLDRLDLLKCDVEGAEYAIFATTPTSLLRRIDRLFLELHFMTLNDLEVCGQLLERLREAGFSWQMESSTEQIRQQLVGGGQLGTMLFAQRHTAEEAVVP